MSDETDLVEVEDLELPAVDEDSGQGFYGIEEEGAEKVFSDEEDER